VDVDGGINVPPTTLTDSVRNDIMVLAEVNGCGEVGISECSIGAHSSRPR
jgi:hypothetical protein